MLTITTLAHRVVLKNHVTQCGKRSQHTGAATFQRSVKVITMSHDHLALRGQKSRLDPRIITGGCLCILPGGRHEQCASNTIRFKKLPPKYTFIFVDTLETIWKETHQY